MGDKRGEQILVFTDFSDYSDCAIQHGVVMAKIFQNELSLLHIADNETNDLSAYQNTSEEAENKLNDYARKIQSCHDIKVNVLIMEGKVFDLINEVSRKTDTTLLVMGIEADMKKESLKRKKRILKTIKDSRYPYLIVQKKPPTENAYKNIVLPLDYTRQAKEKVLWAVSFGKRYGSKIHIIAPKEKDAFISKRIHDNIAFAHKTIEEFNVVHETTMIDKKSSDLDVYAVQFAKEKNAGLVIIMTTKDYGFIDYIFGPPELKVISNTDQLPIMCLNSRDDLYIPCV